MKLNNIKIKNAKPKDKMYRLSDGDNLYLEVTPNGKKRWTLAYRFNDKRKQVAIGSFPLISLAESRELKLEQQKLLLKGIDPVEHKRQQKLDYKSKYEHNFESTARKWFEECKKANKWKSEKNSQSILNQLEKHIFPIIGKKPII